ncbi:unnamed protein product [Clonostachys byssicola]|uniref:Uncharacterized protein n=1 Tax=Clonostachys byssicola TaxID=160290 RepID=A0A9N9UU88_9HYPO|nr:unnamed protein product [Clonostachys byssicola]
MQHSEGTASSSNEERAGMKRKVPRDSRTRSPSPKRPCGSSAEVGTGEPNGADSSGVCSEDHLGPETDQEDSESDTAPKWPIPDETIRARIYDEWRLRLRRPDSIFREVWNMLPTRVWLLARENFPPSYLWKDLSKENQAEIEVWASHAQEWMESSERLRAQCFFEAWIFRLLYDHLFSPECQDKWSCEMWKIYGQQQYALRGYVDGPDSEDGMNSFFNLGFHNWRSMTAEMTLHATGRRWHTEPSRLKDILVDRLGPLISDPRQPFPENLDKNLHGIVHLAIELDILMIYSTLWLKLEMKVPNMSVVKDFAYDDKDMATHGCFYNLSKGAKSITQTVDFICQPSFAIFGRTFTRAESDEHWKAVPSFGNQFDREFQSPSLVQLAINGGEDQGFTSAATTLQDTDVKSVED